MDPDGRLVDRALLSPPTDTDAEPAEAEPAEAPTTTTDTGDEARTESGEA